MDPQERLERLADLGVEIVVIEHFDDTLRRTPYDRFAAGIAERCNLAGFVMTPDAAFGHERGGTPAALAELGRRAGFEVVLVPPFTLAGREVRSSDVRTAIATGELATAARLLGRSYAVTGDLDGDGRLHFPMPVALPLAGSYAGSVDGRTVRIDVSGGIVLVSGAAAGRARVELKERS